MSKNIRVSITHMRTHQHVQQEYANISDLEKIVLDACRSTRQGQPTKTEIDRAAVYAKRIRDGEEVRTGGYRFNRDN